MGNMIDGTITGRVYRVHESDDGKRVRVAINRGPTYQGGRDQYIEAEFYGWAAGKLPKGVSRDSMVEIDYVLSGRIGATPDKMGNERVWTTISGQECRILGGALADATTQTTDTCDATATESVGDSVPF